MGTFNGEIKTRLTMEEQSLIGVALFDYCKDINDIELKKKIDTLNNRLSREIASYPKDDFTEEELIKASDKIMAIQFEPTGEIVKYTPTYYSALPYIKKIEETRPDMLEYYHIFPVSGFKKMWYLWRYPYIKM